MLLSLQKDLHNELCPSISTLHSRIDHAEKRTDSLGRLMTDHATAYNCIPDAYEHHAEEICLLQVKVADLEDRSMRNNIKIRGIPKAI